MNKSESVETITSSNIYKMFTICQGCGIQFEHYKNRKRKFCGKECVDKYHIRWNKGLTKETHPSLMIVSQKEHETKKGRTKENTPWLVRHAELMKVQNLGEKNPFYGKKHSKETKDILSAKSTAINLERWKDEDYRKKCLDKMGRQPKHSTKIEKKVESYLDSLNIKYEKFVNLENITIPDQYIPELKLVIYEDGIYWHKIEKVIKRDKNINKVLKEKGYFVLRLGEDEIHKNFKEVKEKIKQTLDKLNIKDRVRTS